MTEKNNLVEQGKLLEPIMRIGRSGLTDSVIAEIKNQLEKRKMIKIKFLKPALEGKDKKEFAREVAEKAGAVMVHTVGFVVVLRNR